MIEVLKQALTDAKRNERHNNVAETRYWLNQYKLIAEQAIAELESQEPVAWVAEDVCEGQYIDGRPRKIWWECEKGVGTAFYAHPPQRTEERNFCQRCGKRLGKRLDGIDSIHTCTPPMEQNT
jgi:hypothetical protein